MTHEFKVLVLAAVVGALTGCSSNGVREAKAAALKRGTFEVRNEYRVKIPAGARRLRVWLAVPQVDAHQTVASLTIEAPVAHRLEKDSEGNQVAYLEVQDPPAGELPIVETFAVTRTEVRSGVDPKKARPLNDTERQELNKHLEPNQHIVIDERIRNLAGDIVGAETNPVVAARKIYDWVLANIDYWVKDPKNKKASPVGSSTYCLDTRTGNCTDFHSLWAALARASGIPTRLIYGSFLKAELNGQDTDASYHCWPEFYAGGIGWVPHDVAVADIFVGDFAVNADNETPVRRTTADGYRGPEPSKVDYYFGNIDERRVVWSTGRDLTMSPAQEAGPVNALAKAYVELDGKVHPETTGWTRKLTYRELPAN